MKKTVVTLAALLSLGLVACSGNTEESSTSPIDTGDGTSSPSSDSTPVDDEPIITGVSITNKDELTAQWFIESGEARILAIETTPAADNMELLMDGAMKITSSDPNVVTISGLGVNAVGVGTSTITVTVTNSNGTTVTDSVSITIENRPIIQVGPQKVSAIAEGDFYLGFVKADGTTLMATGEMAGFYGATVGPNQAGALYTLAKSGEGWTMRVKNEEGNGQYIAATRGVGTHGEVHNNFVYQNDPFAWTYDEEGGYFHAIVGEEGDTKDVLLGSSGDYGTISVYDISGGATGLLPLVPYNFVEGYAKVSEPASGQTYKFGADKGGNPNNAQCITGDMVNKYYLGTTADPELAQDVTATEATEGWTLKLENGKYIGVAVSGTHLNAVYQDEPHYFEYNTTLETFVSTVQFDGADTEVILGMDATHDTVSAYSMDEVEQTNVAHLYDGYYIADEEIVMTEGPIAAEPEDGVTLKFGVYNDSAANKGYWMITGEMDGYYLGLVKTMNKTAYDGAADVTAVKVTDTTWNLKLADDKYIMAKMSDDGEHTNILYGEQPYAWTYDASRKVFTTVLNEETYFIGGGKQFDTLSLSADRKYDDSTHAGFFTWGKYDTETPDPDPAPAFPAKETAVETTVGAILDGTTAAANTLYKVSGIVEGRDYDNAYGNAYLTDPTTGESIALYGLVTHYDAFYINDKGEYAIKNPATSDEDLKDVPNGSNVTVIGYWTTWAKNLSAYLDSHTTNTDTYDVEINAGEHGSATLSAETATYGTEITVTTEPAEGYIVDEIYVTNAWGQKIYLESSETNVYKFNATCVNKVTVTFKDQNAKATSVVLNPTVLGFANESSYTDGTATITIDGTEVGITYANLRNGGRGEVTQMNKTTSLIYNTTALPYEIESIEFTYDTQQKGDSKGRLAVSFGTSAITEDSDEIVIDPTQGLDPVTINCDVEGATFFRINKPVDGALYFSSITINFAQA